MAKASFESRIDEILNALGTGKSGTGYEKTKSKLREICDKLETAISKGAKKAVVVTMQPGFRANMGQQLNIVVRIPEQRYQDTLFRAYIPLEGFPVYLDFYAEQPVRAETLEEMDEAVLGFLSQEDIQNRLSDYRDLAMK